MLYCMSSKRTRILCVVNGDGNSKKYVSVLNDFPIPCLKYEFGNYVRFTDENVLRHRSGIM